jgi:nitrogen regulatory protein PII
MKLVIAFFQPHQLPAVKKALHEAQVPHMTCTNVLGTTANLEEHQRVRGVEHEITLFQKVRIEIGTTDEAVDQLVEALVQGGRASGGIGKIFVAELSDCISVETGARGPSEI